jgi:hypothetical protein
LLLYSLNLALGVSQLAGHLLHQLHANKFSGTIHHRAINKFFWRRFWRLKKKKLPHQIHAPPSTWHHQSTSFSGAIAGEK